jgi:CDP-glycerol glycerophosphotransferase
MRGFYLDLADLPGPIVHTQDELVTAILAATQPDPELSERYDRFNKRFTYLDDGHAAERVIERVMAP